MPPNNGLMLPTHQPQPPFGYLLAPENNQNTLFCPQSSLSYVMPHPHKNIQLSQIPGTSQPLIHQDYNTLTIQQHPRAISSHQPNTGEVSHAESTEMEEDRNPWQAVKKRKWEGHHHCPNNINQFQINVQNRYATLNDGDCEPTHTNESTKDKPHKPPPLFIYDVQNFKSMIDSLTTVTAEETFHSKALANGTVKVSAHTIDTYRKLAKHLRDKKIIHHTYQLKEDRSYRIVIRNLHYSVPPEDIKAELENAGHKVRAVTNVRHRQTKDPLSLFFVDLEPHENNKTAFDIKFILHTKVVIEPPRKRNDIIQCTRCQAYGHSKSYCTKPFTCVKCGGGHDTKICKKPATTTATCALCAGAHPANYKGCSVYQKLVAAKQNPTKPRHPPLSSVTAHSDHVQSTRPYPINKNYPPEINMHHLVPTYSQILSGATQATANGGLTSVSLDGQFTVFLNEFKAMFSQLMSQNSMILNLLTAVISKLNP